jgi:folate-binding protein YgfZ
MNSHWRAFLTSRSAEISKEDQVRFPAAPPAADCALVDLSDLRLIAVAGPDARDFLQGQLTNDVRALSPTQSQLSAHCSPKGRMLASFRVFQVDESFYLQLPRSRLAATLQRLRMFVLRAKVTLEDASDRLVRVGISGACTPRLLRGRFPALPEHDNGVSGEGDLVAIRIPGTTTRFEILGATDQVAGLWDTLMAEATVVNSDYWSLLDIRAGLPTVYTETADAFVPQMVNMQLIEGVSFTKGCYTGQEVVARMQYLGKLKRRMYLAEIRTEKPPKPGDELHSRSSTSEQACGWVVDARPNATGHFELLAVAEIEAAERGEVHLGTDGPQLTMTKPPYGFPPEV